MYHTIEAEGKAAMPPRHVFEITNENKQTASKSIATMHTTRLIRLEHDSFIFIKRVNSHLKKKKPVRPWPFVADPPTVDHDHIVPYSKTNTTTTTTNKEEYSIHGEK
jgi:hypothetical protein